MPAEVSLLGCISSVKILTAFQWLHRCAYSWGNPQGPEVNAIWSNFVFGTSESNSLMTR
jgi:hypothetical protein